MKHHLPLTGIHLIVCLWISCICVDHVCQGQGNNRPNVERRVLDGGVQVVRITIKSNPLDQSGRVRPNVQQIPKPVSNQGPSFRSNSATSTSAKLSGTDNRSRDQGQSRVNQRGTFIQRNGVSTQSQIPNRNSPIFRKASLPSRTFDFRGNQVRNDQTFQRYEPVSRGPVNRNSFIRGNTQFQPPSRNNNQVNNILPDFPKPKTRWSSVGNNLPIVKAVESTTLSQQIPANFIPEFSMINQFESQGIPMGSVLPNYNQNLQTNVNNNGQAQNRNLQSNMNRNQQSSNYNQKNSNQNQPGSIQNINFNGYQQMSNQNVKSNLNTNRRISNSNSNQGNSNLWTPNLNTNQRTSDNRLQTTDPINTNNQQRSTQQPVRSIFHNSQGLHNQWLPHVNTNQQTSNQQISNFNNNQQISSRGSQAPIVNNNQGNVNRWMPNSNANQRGQNQVMPKVNTNYKQGANKAHLVNNPTIQPSNQNSNQQAPNIDQVGLRKNQHMSNFNNNHQGFSQGSPNSNINQQTFNQGTGINRAFMQPQRMNPFRRNNMAMQMARYLSMQNRELPNRNQWPFFGQMNNLPNQQTALIPELQVAQAGPASTGFQENMPIADPTGGQNPLSDLGQGQMDFGQGQMQTNPQGQLELLRNQGQIPQAGGTNLQTAGGFENFPTPFGSHGSLNIPGFSNQVNSPTGSSQSMRGNTSAFSSSIGQFPSFQQSFQQRMMMRTTFYERACNIGATILNRSEPMACNCYPRRECESILFMYVSPVTRRECATRTTGYTCCCEEQRTITIG